MLIDMELGTDIAIDRNGTIKRHGGENMHPAREQRVREELKGAKALSLTLEFSLEIGNGAITNTLVFNGMPALLFESEGKQVIKCLPLNQLGMGDTKDEAFEVLGEDLADLLTEIFNESALFGRVNDMMKGRVAQVYWDEYEQLSKQHPMPKKIERRIKNIKIETDTAIDPVLLKKYFESSDPVITV